MTASNFSKTRLALIGAGNMAEALIRGALAAKLLDPRKVPWRSGEGRSIAQSLVRLSRRQADNLMAAV